MTVVEREKEGTHLHSLTLSWYSPSLLPLGLYLHITTFTPLFLKYGSEDYVSDHILYEVRYSPLCHSTTQGNWSIPYHLGKVTGHWRVVLLFLTKLVELHFAVPLVNAAKGISESNTNILTDRFPAASFLWFFCCFFVIFLFLFLTYTVFIFGLLLRGNQFYIISNLFPKRLSSEPLPLHHLHILCSAPGPTSFLDFRAFCVLRCALPAHHHRNSRMLEETGQTVREDRVE